MNIDRIQHILHEARSCRLLVVGDVMLDEFVWGRVSRISPEAPVPVVEVQGESLYPGGAANVARNLRPFCAEVGMCGLVGKDDAARRLAAILEKEGVSSEGLVATDDLPTIVKTRIVARQQQVVRVDRERRGVNVVGARQDAIERIRSMIGGVEAIIFEDYGKGLLDQPLVDTVCKLAGEQGIIVTADPNPTNLLRWQGVRVLKPNRAEAFAMVGASDFGPHDNPIDDHALLDVAQRLLDQQGVPAALITLGEHGMLLVERGADPYHTPTRAREVFDVSGAGDTAIALFTLALCAGASLPEAAEISNHASGIVVGKLGTATVLPEELLASFAH